VPAGPAYLLFDVDRGEEFRNLAPAAAMEGMTSQGAPKLGWCWYGNPHTWLGPAGTRRPRLTLGNRRGGGGPGRLAGSTTELSTGLIGSPQVVHNATH
jgi:hypothetical protein